LTRIARNDVKGALVADVAQNSNSAEAGLRPGDIIEEINHQPVAGADDAMKLCNDANGKQILLKVCHIIQGQVGTRYLSVDNTVEK
jgi:serine protease Do